jgi:hypothetical protein
LRPDPVPLLLVTLGLLGSTPTPGPAEIDFDFEQRYFMEPGLIAADHALLTSENAFHLIYTVGIQGEGWILPGNMIDFGHASSEDLVHWTIHPRVLSIEAPGWKERNLWAPHILRAGGSFQIHFTGVDSSIAQQVGLASSVDLFNWEEPPSNPVYKPDTTWAEWQLGQWSNCRDPFVMQVDNQQAMLTTASTRPGYQGIPDGRGAIALAFSSAPGVWEDTGAPLFINDSFRVIESTSMTEFNSTFYLFYNEGGIPGVHYMTSSEQFSGWDKSTAELLEFEGFAAEVLKRGNEWLFARVRDGLWDDLPILGIKIDPLSWEGGTPTIGQQNRMLESWTIVSGDAFDLQPTFGDRPAERTGQPSNIEGFFWIATAEQHAGPIAWGCPECEPDESRTGILRSVDFRVRAEYLAFRIGGGHDIENLHLSLHLTNGGELFRSTGHDAEAMRDEFWDLRPFRSRQVYLEIADLSPTGHVNIDWIRETDEPPATTGMITESGAAPALMRVSPLATPGRAPFRFRVTLDRAAPLRLAIYDVSGRQVRTVNLGRVGAGESDAVWDGRVMNGARAAHGVYFYRLVAPHAEARGRLVLAP